MLVKTISRLWNLSWQRATGIISVLPARSFTKAKPALSKTIFALSSGQGRCGVAVIRVSGPSCSEAVKRLCGMQKLPPPRLAALKRLFDPGSGEMIDRGLVLWFPGPRSFTGEDCAEFQVHGGTAVVSAMLEALGTLPGLHPAEPGEFTKRAFLNGKMDLTEVEGLGDLIHAETAAQRRQAVRQMEGDLGNIYADWRKRILKCLAHVEAFIDFSEDENIEDDALDQATAEIMKVSEELKRHLSDDRRGERLRDGVRVAIIGQPNVGKSSLLNIVCQRPAAIVSPMAGTTRDVVETAINLAGYPVLLSDTAGLRETSDAVEEEGVRRALDRAAKADLKVLVLDALDVVLTKPPSVSWSQFVSDHMERLGVCTTSADSMEESQQQGQSSTSERLEQTCDVTSAVESVNLKGSEQQGPSSTCKHLVSAQICDVTDPVNLDVSNSKVCSQVQRQHHLLHFAPSTSERVVRRLSCELAEIRQTAPYMKTADTLNSQQELLKQDYADTAATVGKSRGLGVESGSSLETGESPHDGKWAQVKEAETAHCEEGRCGPMTGQKEAETVHREEGRCGPMMAVGRDVIVVLNKWDLLSCEQRSLWPGSIHLGEGASSGRQLGLEVCCLSCTTRQGLSSFVTLLAQRVQQLCGDPLAHSPSLTQSRHRTHLTSCQCHLHAYLRQVHHLDTVLAAQALRHAMRDLGKVTGAVNVEDVLDVIFKDFCIGK